MKYATFHSSLIPTVMLVAGLTGGAASLFGFTPGDREVLPSVTDSQTRSSCAVAAQLAASTDTATRDLASRMLKESACKAS